MENSDTSIELEERMFKNMAQQIILWDPAGKICWTETLASMVDYLFNRTYSWHGRLKLET